ncbi:maleylpyruvate isomerase family mycothiol-dependent enzyme [Streptomyces sp. NPDC006339]|uniref:maleylpyruvate isomerase family mycothiol-dependent enzyme n=1 Tax=Streptomyces sp. NPDC006339 TaxID=3156755 RepID=UPI0033A1AA9B
MSDALLNTLAEALADLVTSVETADDDVLDLDTGVKWLESTAYILRRLPAADRRALDRLFRDAALREPPGPRRDELLQVSEGFGLTEDDHLVHCDLVESYVERLVALVREADPATPVPTCPGWTLADLVKHHAATHRWIEYLVRTRATERVEPTDGPLDPPGDPAAYADRLAESAELSLRTLRAADPDAPMWCFGADPHARFFPRRLLFEAVVHLADAELALGREPAPVEAGTAADGIDELLENVPYYSWVAERVARLGRDGASLRLTATDTGAAWTVTLGGGGFTWQRRAEGDATTTVDGTAADLLLLLYGRRPADDPRYAHTGDRTLLDAWLTATAL